MRVNSIELMYIYTSEQKQMVKELYGFTTNNWNTVTKKDKDYIIELRETTQWTTVDLTYDEETRFVLNRIREAFISYYTVDELLEKSEFRKMKHLYRRKRSY